MLRKRIFVLNGKKADGNEKIKAGDSSKNIFFQDETILKNFQMKKQALKLRLCLMK